MGECVCVHVRVFAYLCVSVWKTDGQSLRTNHPHPVCFRPPPVDPPQITQQPVDQLNVDPGSSVMFSVTVTTAIGALTYQWQLDGIFLPSREEVNGTTTRTLTLSNVQESSEGNYSCIVTNDGGSVNSDPAQLTICKCKI